MLHTATLDSCEQPQVGYVWSIRQHPGQSTEGLEQRIRDMRKGEGVVSAKHPLLLAAF